MSIFCNFCNKEFTNIGNLNVHLKSAKYCLSKRNIEIQTLEPKCQYCDKIFSSKQMCKLHEQKCSSKEFRKELEEKDKLLSLKDQEIMFLKQQLDFQSKEIQSYKDQINSIILENIRSKSQIKNVIEEKNNPLNSDVTVNKKDLEKKSAHNSLIIKDSYQLVYRPEDGYIDVTNLCKAGEKQFNDWKRLNKTAEFLKVLSSSTGNPGNELLKYQSGSNSERKTWAHPQVAINIAQWISPEFDVQVSRWVYEIMLTGKTDIGNHQTTQQLDQLAKENQQYAEKIQYFERKFIQKSKRTEYPEQNVVYIITNNSRESKKEYKIGKTYNLTNRLSTYNTSEDHKVIFVQECHNQEEMNKLEKIVFLMLEGLRVQANREWFCGEVDEMISIIKECKAFIDRGK